MVQLILKMKAMSKSKKRNELVDEGIEKIIIANDRTHSNRLKMKE